MNVISFKCALMLKRMGYNNKVTTAYKIEVIDGTNHIKIYEGKKSNWNELVDFVSAPTLESARKWINKRFK